MLNTIDLTENDLSSKQNESNLIYARQYEVERDVTHISTEVHRDEQTLNVFNSTLNESSSLIDTIQEQVTNLTGILHDRKPADVREILENIAEKSISLTSTQLEESINDIRSLVDQAQQSSQTGNEGEKIRDATLKLNRAKDIENDLFTYVR